MLKRELKVNLKNFIIWTSTIVGFILIAFLIYPSLNNSFKDIDKLMNSLPKELLVVFNMDIVSIKDVFGWYATEGYLLVCLFSSMFVCLLGYNILIKEESDKTIEFLYSKPISKNEIITSKILASLIYVFALNLIITIVTFVGFKLSNCFDFTKWLLMCTGPLILNVVFLFISMFLSAMSKGKRSLGLPLAIVMISYLLQIISSFGEKLKFLKHFSLFEYFNSRYILTDNNFEPVYLILSVIILLTSIIGIYAVYNKKEF